MKALQIEAFGKPAEVVKETLGRLVQIPDPGGMPDALDPNATLSQGVTGSGIDHVQVYIGNDREHNESNQTRERAPHPPPPRATSPQFIAHAGAARRTKEAHGRGAQPTISRDSYCSDKRESAPQPALPIPCIGQRGRRTSPLWSRSGHGPMFDDTD